MVPPLSILPARCTGTTVVGGGIAGCWAALKLVSRGIPTILVSYESHDRGGYQGASNRSVGAINTSPIDEPNFLQQLDEITLRQANPTVGPLLTRHLQRELDQLRMFTSLQKITLGCKPAGMDARGLLQRLKAEFTQRGGELIDGWVNRIVFSETSCHGLQYQTSTEPNGRIKCHSVVLASGGYAGLFSGSVQTACYGTTLGQFLRCGGMAVNLEFLFKHGFGKPDMGKLTPTEELRGAEIRDDEGKHVEWLELALFLGTGTSSHQTAITFWRRNSDRQYFVNVRGKRLFERVQACNHWFQHRGAGDVANGSARMPLKELVELFPAERQAEVEQRVTDQLTRHGRIDFDFFRELRSFCRTTPDDDRWERIRHIPYFTMGGAAHWCGQTNLRQVFVTGEIMDDFGANRVGGLPWGLYLVAGELIARQIVHQAGRNVVSKECDFVASPRRSVFDTNILEIIRNLLQETLERNLTDASAERAADELRHMRRSLSPEQLLVDDSANWLIVAEAIVRSAKLRKESRGCFAREDFPVLDPAFTELMTVARYDASRDEVETQLLPRAKYRSLVPPIDSEVAWL